MSEAELEGVLEANQAFYDAFEARDIDAMSEVWEHTDRVVCTHPGWGTFGAGGDRGVVVHPVRQQRAPAVHRDRQRPEIDGDIGWVVCDENILGGGGGGGTVAALNLFAKRAGGRWRVPIAHHGSPVIR